MGQRLRERTRRGRSTWQLSQRWKGLGRPTQQGRRIHLAGLAALRFCWELELEVVPEQLVVDIVVELNLGRLDDGAEQARPLGRAVNRQT